MFIISYLVVVDMLYERKINDAADWMEDEAFIVCDVIYITIKIVVVGVAPDAGTR